MSLPLFGDARAAAIDAVHAATALYTAEAVVEDLLDRVAWPLADRRLVDPSAGDGEFLACALKRLLRCRPDVTAAGVADVLEGWEFHPHAAGQARRRLAELAVSNGWSPADAADMACAVLHNADFLTDGPREPRFDIVAANPPYIVWSKVPPVLREEYASTVPLYAQADLLYAFVDRFSACLRPGGEIIAVVSDRLLINSKAAQLRAVLGSRGLAVGHIERLDADSAFTRPKNRRRGSAPRVHPVSLVLRRGDDRPGIPLDHRAIYPELLSHGRDDGSITLADIAEVRMAPWLGPDGVFVVDGHTAGRLHGADLVPVVDLEDVRAGVGMLARRYAIRTRPDQEPPAAVLTHLQATQHLMPARGRRGKVWMPPEGFHQFDLRHPALFLPRIALGLTPIEIPAGVLPINHHLVVRPTGTTTMRSLVDALHSDVARRWFAATAPRLENGYRFLQTKHLRAMPIPG